ncbi:MAG: 2Fe-2S iron-sulfur cluster binding domain-containing protein [Planctomycetales bacterium]|nr:2Fe-2S iron-sulfur cluster binding domain-containing protein [Planctomycetales bacterium]
MTHVGTFLGTGLCLFVFVQLLMQTAQSAQRVLTGRRQSTLRTQQIREQLQELRQRHERVRVFADDWKGFRKFEVARKVVETENCVSIYLRPHDGRPLPAFKPGQYLTFSAKIPGSDRPLVRCYSLSDAPRPDYYRITVKRVPAPADQPGLPPGRISSHFVQELRTGDILDVKSPSGTFCLDLESRRPVVLLAGGIGITPLLSMLRGVVEEGRDREVYLFYGIANSNHHTFREQLESLAAESSNVRIHTAYSRPLEQDKMGREYDSPGRIDLKLLRSVLPSNNFDFFVCGPPTFMQDVLGSLRAWGVPEQSIHAEAFGPAAATPRRETKSAGLTCQVHFDRSGKTVVWNTVGQTLLELAETQGVVIDSGCRTGNCGACSTAIKSGQIEYLSEPGTPPAPGTCLPCISCPKGELSLDA